MTYTPVWKRDIPHFSELYKLLGLNPNRHLPEEGLQPKDVNGVQVYVKPKHEMVAGKRKHRVVAVCPGCNKHVPAGRLFQHKCNPR